MKRDNPKWLIPVLCLVLTYTGCVLYYAATEGARQKYERDVNVAREALRREGLGRR